MDLRHQCMERRSDRGDRVLRDKVGGLAVLKTWLDEYIPKIAADSSVPSELRHDLISKLMVVREFELERLRTMPCPRCSGSGRVRKPDGAPIGAN